MLVTLPSGQAVLCPVAPRTWIEQASAVPGDAVTAWDLEQQVSAAVAFHRERPLFQGLGTVPQALPSADWTPITLSAVYDLYGGHNSAANPSRVEAPITADLDSWYLCVGMIPHGAAASGAGIAGLRVGGSGTIYEGAKLPLGSGHACTAMVCDLLNVPAGQYVELMGYQNSGSNLSTSISDVKVVQLAMRWATVDPANGTTVTMPGTPRTWTPDDLLTADSAGTDEVPLNVHLRDVLRFLRMPPAVRVDSAGSTQTLTSGSWQAIEWTGAQLDNYGGFSGAAPTRYTVQRPGLYFVYGLAAVAEASGASGYRAARLAVNGTTFYGGTSAVPPSGTTVGTHLAACAHLRLEVGDYIEMQMRPQGDDVAVKFGAGDASKLVAVWRGF